MVIQRYKKGENPYRDELIEILLELDDQSRDEETISDMSRNLFIEDDKNVSDREALNVYYEEVTDEAIVAVDRFSSTVMGFSLVKKNNTFFESGAEEYFPHLAVTQSVTRKEYQRQGVWSNIRTYIEEHIVQDYDVEYLVSAVSEENTASQNANESKGMEQVSTLDYDDEETTYVYAKTLTSSSS